MRAFQKIIFLFILCQSELISSQNKSVFPDSNAVWFVQSYAPDCYFITPPHVRIAAYSYYLSGDTLLNGKVYNKLYRKNDFIERCKPVFYPDVLNGFLSGIRYDSATNAVYIHPKDSLIEYLLYPFNIKPGDSINNYLLTLGGCPPTIIKDTFSTYINGKLYMSCEFENVGCWGGYTEFIGNYGGLVEPYTGHGQYSELKCFSVDGEVLFTLDTSTNCPYDLSTEIAKSKLEKKVSISPNPFSDYLDIKLGDIEYDNLVMNISIYNMFGEEVFNDDIIQYRISTSFLDSGVYLIYIRSLNGSIYCQKLIKI